MRRHFLEKLGLAVYEDGKIFSVVTKRWLKASPCPLGYMRVYFKDLNGKRKSTSVHRLIAEAFIPNPDNKPEVNHKDCVKNNNNVDNLEWVTKSENHFHAAMMGKKKNCGPKPPPGRFEKVRELRKTGLSYQKIGEIMGISGTMARYICVREAA